MRRGTIVISAVFFAFILLIFGREPLRSLLHGRAGSVPAKEIVRITIPEGWTVHQINEELTTKGVLQGGSLSQEWEGYLFPDTYDFFVPSSVEEVRAKFLTAFQEKVTPIVPDGVDMYRVLTVASLVEREVPEGPDRPVVAGIIEKRLEAGMRLQIDATICYAKEPSPCTPIKKEDKESDSPYNTYRVNGLPPGPIGNPGIDSIKAALDPQTSSYWYYISDPETQRTIFAVDLDEQNENIVKYLK